MKIAGLNFVITGAGAGIGAGTARLAELVCFLASPAANFINGAVWLIDGGSLAWRSTLDVLGMGDRI